MLRLGRAQWRCCEVVPRPARRRPRTRPRPCQVAGVRIRGNRQSYRRPDRRRTPRKPALAAGSGCRARCRPSWARQRILLVGQCPRGSPGGAPLPALAIVRSGNIPRDRSEQEPTSRVWLTRGRGSVLRRYRASDHPPPGEPPKYSLAEQIDEVSGISAGAPYYALQATSHTQSPTTAI